MWFNTLTGLLYRMWHTLRWKWWIATLISLSIPIIFAVLLVAASSKVSFGFTSSQQEEPVSFFPKEAVLKDGSKYTAVVTPDNNQTRRLLDRAFSGKVKYVPNVEELQRILIDNKLGEYSYVVGIIVEGIDDNSIDYTIRSRSPTFSQVYTKADHPLDWFQIFDHSFLAKVLVDESFIFTQMNESVNWALASLPYPEITEWKTTFFPVVRLLSLVLSCVIVVIYVQFGVAITRDKMSGINELLKMSGVPPLMMNFMWFLLYAVLLVIVALATSYILHIGDLAPAISPELLATVLTLYSLAGLSCVYFVASLITSTKLFVIIILIYWYASIAFAYSILELHRTRYIITASLCFLTPNGALMMISYAYQEFDEAFTFLDFSTMFTPPPRSLPVGYVLIAMVASTVFWFLLAVYFNLINPGPYGLAKPWYLFRRTNVVHPTRRGPSLAASSYVQNVGKSSVGIHVVRLVKKFGKLTAVDDLSMKVVKNEITVLLGHNGAGKSTLFLMISGMLPATSGEIFVGDKNIYAEDNMRDFRKKLGYCPQHDLLLDDLTVKQHLILFGILKGLSYSNSKKQALKLIEKFGIATHKNKRVAQLSGGTKRKLSLAIALTGEPEYLLLDEPSSGLDPESRRLIWDGILLIRRQCTVLITTHFMEEAEALGDRIALMSHGKLKSYGTQMFLKTEYGIGYKLDCVFGARNVDDVVEIVQRHMPAKVTNRTDQTIMFNLPLEYADKVPQLLRALDSKDVHSTLSYSTVDDIFLKAHEDEGISTAVTDIPTSGEGTLKRSVWQQMLGHLFLQTWWLIRNWKSLLILVLAIPIGGATIMVIVLADLRAERTVSLTKPVPMMSLRDYPQSEVIIFGNSDDPMNERLVSAVERQDSSYKFVTSENVPDALMNIAKKNLLRYKTKNIVAFDSLTAYFSRLTYHAAPVAYSTLLEAAVPNLEIVTKVHHLPFYTVERDASISPSCDVRVEYVYMNVMCVQTLLPVVIIMCLFFIILPHIERTELFKHLQLMTGVFPVTYWTSFLVFDFALYFLIVVLMIIVIAIGDTSKFLASSPTIWYVFISLLLFGLSNIPFMYVGSFFFRRYNISMVLFGLIPVFVSLAVLVVDVAWKVHWLVTLSYLIPWQLLSNSFIRIVTWKQYDHLCNFCGNHKFCGKALDDEANKLRDKMYWYLVDFMVYFLIINALDCGLITMTMTWIKKILVGKIKTEKTLDEDVKAEKERVDALEKANNRPESEDPIFISHGLGKKYSRKFVAVKDVTFAVLKGECFGLLGVNGAGKSTTFGMMTGTVTRTKGWTVINKKSLSIVEPLNCYRYSRQLGYCPQEGGLLLDLSARSQISYFARLRGVASSDIRSLTKKWIVALEMEDICDRPCKIYSGGNKRKLSLAMSMVGDPAVVLLDEPTSGVDVIVTRKVWAILKYCCEVNQLTAVISSHSMLECEALCGRLTVMVGGEMRCIGPVPSLKKKFARVCFIKVILIPECTPEEQNSVSQMIEEQFDATLKDQNPNYMSFAVMTEKFKTYQVLEMMRTIQSKDKYISEFNVTDATLEEVFLSFAGNKTSAQDKKPAGSISTDLNSAV